jgi:hypothetical protein
MLRPRMQKFSKELHDQFALSRIEQRRVEQEVPIQDIISSQS